MTQTIAPTTQPAITPALPEEEEEEESSLLVLVANTGSLDEALGITIVELVDKTDVQVVDLTDVTLVYTTIYGTFDVNNIL